MQGADISVQMVCDGCCDTITKLSTDVYLGRTELAYLRVASESPATVVDISLWGAVLTVKMGAGS
jgi:hypothetical protein